VVSDEEKKAAADAFRAKFLSKHDRNADGALTEDEVPPRVWEHIAPADANHDGKVDAAELATVPPPHRGFSH